MKVNQEDIPRLIQCLTCKHLGNCKPEEESEDEYGLCKFWETKEERRMELMNALKRILSCVILLLLLCGCTESQKVSQNIAKEADNFNVYRRVVIINTRTDKPEFEIVGKMSVNIGSDRIDCIVEENGKYYKHIINLTENNMYVVEDLGGSDVSQYKYEINYIPESIIPITVTESK